MALTAIGSNEPNWVESQLRSPYYSAQSFKPRQRSRSFLRILVASTTDGRQYCTFTGSALHIPDAVSVRQSPLPGDFAWLTGSFQRRPYAYRLLLIQPVLTR